MDNLLDFPHKQPVENILAIPEEDFKFALMVAFKEARSKARSEGFLLGCIMASLMHIVITFIFK